MFVIGRPFPGVGEARQRGLHVLRDLHLQRLNFAADLGHLGLCLHDFRALGIEDRQRHAHPVRR